MFIMQTWVCFIHLHHLPDLWPRWWSRCLPPAWVFMIAGRTGTLWLKNKREAPWPTHQLLTLIFSLQPVCRLDLGEIRETNGTSCDPIAGSQEGAIPPALGYILPAPYFGLLITEDPTASDLNEVRNNLAGHRGEQITPPQQEGMGTNW